MEAMRIAFLLGLSTMALYSRVRAVYRVNDELAEDMADMDDMEDMEDMEDPRLVENKETIVSGSVYICPDLTPIPYNGAKCPEAKMCANFTCEEHQGYVARSTIEDRSKTPCNKFGCLASCCDLECNKMDENKTACEAVERCGTADKKDLSDHNCRELVKECTPKKDARLLLSSKGLANATGGDPENNLIKDVVIAFRKLVRAKFPDMPALTTKAEASSQDWSYFNEDGGKTLKVLVVADACYVQLTTSAGWHGCEDFRWQLTGMKYKEEDVEPGIGLPEGSVIEIGLMDAAFDPGVVKESKPSIFTGKDEENTEGVPEDPSKQPFLEMLKHEVDDAIKEPDLTPIIDRIKSNKYKPSEAARKKWKLNEEKAGEGYTAKDLLDQADVVAFNGGNPDFLLFAMRANQVFFETLQEKVNAGKLIYLGRSAGAMVAGWDISMSVEEGSRDLLGCDGNGEFHDEALKLVGDCVIRPHYDPNKYDVAVSLYQRMTGRKVVRIPNGEAMQCMDGTCKMFGLKGRTGRTSFPYHEKCKKAEDPPPHAMKNES